MDLDKRWLESCPCVSICAENGDRFLQGENIFHLWHIREGIKEALLYGARITKHVINSISQELPQNRFVATHVEDQ
jgi:hypothetical protein